MNLSVFDFISYKNYLRESLGGVRKRTGLRASLSKHIGCQTAYLSQVLNAHSHLSLEQAFKVNEFLEHDSDASEFFLFLVQKDRAGTTELADYFQKKMDRLILTRLNIKTRLKKSKEVTEKDQARYYSTWLPLAVHMALSIPELQTKSALKEHFQLDIGRLNEVLEFLTSTGLVDSVGDRSVMGKTQIHLSKNSDNILKHHNNWRLQALKSLDLKREENLHYSVTYSLSQKDSEKIKNQIIKLIQDNLKIVEPSKEEVLYCNTIDFFEV